MPKFMDFHPQMPQLPPEAVEMMVGRVKAGKPDEFGVKPINVFLGTGGQGFCLTEAPNAEAVSKSHTAVGVPVGNDHIIEVNSLV